MIKVTNVDKGSVADRIGIVPGDTIVSFDNNLVQDILDIIFAESKDRVLVQLLDRVVTIIKEPYEPFGMDYEDSIYISPRRCANKCIFCFIDQMPKGMRDTLYVKDDDYRMSFITGSYITLTNLTNNDIDRIIEYRLSPLYISIHAYDSSVRAYLLGNKRCGGAFEIIDRFANNGILMHMQIVLCPDINDGKVLEETLDELYRYYPNVQSVAVVPVGLTKFRDNLHPIRPMLKEDAIKAVDIVEKINGKAKNKFCWCSDELYLKARKELPNSDYYGNFDQIENGVGMIATFYRDIANNKWLVKGEYHIITGASFYPILDKVVRDFSYIGDSKVIVHKIVNNYFGERVSVAGLITGKDILNSLNGKLHNKILLVPRVIFKEFEEVTLDGMTKDELQKELRAKIIIVDDINHLAQILNGVE